jgi:hypothetical protein
MQMMQQIWKRTRPQSLASLLEIHDSSASHKMAWEYWNLEESKTSMSFEFAGNTGFLCFAQKFNGMGRGRPIAKKLSELPHTGQQNRKCQSVHL